MKIFKNNYIKVLLTAAIFVFSGCSDEFLDVNENPNVAAEGEMNFLLTSAQSSIGGEFSTGLGFGGAVYARHLYGLGTSTYAITGATYQEDWEDLYSEGLKDLNQVLVQAEEQENFGYLGISKVLTAYTFHQLVDFFGDIPYTEALQGETIVSPVFDDDADVYDELITLLDEAVANLDTAASRGDIVEGDLMFGGNYENWVRAANTLKIKMFLNIGNVDAGRATTGIQDILDNDGRIIDAAQYDWQLDYTDQQVPNGRHPFYNSQYDTSPDYLDNFIMLRLLNLGDPRIRYYFYRQATYGDLDFQTTPCSSRTDCDTWEELEDFDANYIGRDHGDPSGLPGDDNLVTVPGLFPWGGKYDDSSYNTVNANSSNPANQGALGAGFLPIFTSYMTHFMLAEATLTLGVNTGTTTVDHYQAGMEDSFAKVRDFALASSEASRVEAFETGAGFDYDTQAGNYVTARVGEFGGLNANEQLNAIMIQKNIACWGNGMEPYTDLRRTGFPNDLPASLAPQGPFPLRVLYPDSEISANPNAPQTIVPQSTPVFWDN